MGLPRIADYLFRGGLIAVLFVSCWVWFVT